MPHPCRMCESHEAVANADGEVLKCALTAMIHLVEGENKQSQEGKWRKPSKTKQT